MRIKPLSVLPAAGLAAATLLPAATPRRRLIGTAVVTTTYAVKAAADPSGFMPVTVTSGEGHRLGRGQARAVSTVASSLVMGLLATPLVGATRLLPMRRVFAAAAVAGGYLVLDAKMVDFAETMKQKALVAQHTAQQARERMGHGQPGRTQGKWHQVPDADGSTSESRVR